MRTLDALKEQITPVTLLVRRQFTIALAIVGILQPQKGGDSMTVSPLGQRLVRYLGGLIIGAVIGLALIMCFALVPGAFGLTPLVVVSGSMEPTLYDGDIAVVRDIEPFDLRIGDVATYKSEIGYVTHRIVGLDITPRGPLFLMKGDANLTADLVMVPSELIVAKVAYRIPKLGMLVSATNSAPGRLFLILAPVLLLTFSWLRSRYTLLARTARRAG